MEESAGQTESGTQTSSGHNVTDLRDGVERQQTFEVMLCQRHGNTDEHGHGAKTGEQQLHCWQIHCLEDYINQSDHAVNARFVYHTGEYHGDGSWSGGVSVSSRCVEWNDVGFYTQTSEHESECHNSTRVQTGGQYGRQLCHVQSVALCVEHYDTQQSEGRTDGADYKVFESSFSGGFLLAAEGSQCYGCEGHDFDHNEHVEHVAGEYQTQYGTGQHQEQSVVVAKMVVAFHVTNGVDAAQQEGTYNHDCEEQVQLVYFVADTDGIAAHWGPVTHPVIDDLAAEEHRFDQCQSQQCRDGSCRKSDAVAESFIVCAEDLDEEGAKEQQHNCHYRKVNVRNHYPCSPLTSSAFLVLYCL